jgi:hypothetical protein
MQLSDSSYLPLIVLCPTDFRRETEFFHGPKTNIITPKPGIKRSSRAISCERFLTPTQEKPLQNRQTSHSRCSSRPTNRCGSINTTSGNEASQEGVLERSPARLIARTPCRACRATCALDTVGPDLPEPRCEEVLGFLQVKFSTGVSLSELRSIANRCGESRENSTSHSRYQAKI